MLIFLDLYHYLSTKLIKVGEPINVVPLLTLGASRNLRAGERRRVKCLSGTSNNSTSSSFQYSNRKSNGLLNQSLKQLLGGAFRTAIFFQKLFFRRSLSPTCSKHKYVTSR